MFASGCKQQRIAQSWRQPTDPRPNPPGQISRECGLLGIRRVTGSLVDWIAIAERSRRLGTHTPESANAATVQRFAPDDRQQPSPKRRVAAKGLQLLPRDHEGFLCRIFGVLARI